MILLAKIALGVAATSALGVAVLCSEGFVDVNVVETQPESHHVHIIAPALLLPIAVHFVPTDDIRRPSGQIQPWMPAIRAAVEGLRHSPDMTLVEVSQPNAHVEISKHGGSIIVDVHDPANSVYVSVPLRTISSVTEQIASRSPAQAAGSQAF